MNTIADIVLGAIRAQICGQQFHIDSALSEELLENVYDFSGKQDMVHLVAAELFTQKALDQSPKASAFKKQQFMAVYRYERIRQELEATCRVLEEAGIPYMPLKGAVMRQYYPEPWMRTSSDIDVLVPKKDVDAAAELLVRQLSYENHGVLEHDVQMFSPSGVHLELHFETIEDYQLDKANKVLQNVWEDAVCVGGHHYVMSDEMFYFYHVAHMAKHVINRGCGIRFLLDMWILNHKVQYDEKKKKALLKTGDLYEFAKHAEHLSEVWFGDAEHTDVTERMEKHILGGGGVFGGDESSMAVKSVRHGGKLGYTMYLIFRPLNELRRTYTILYKHKWLYPFCQIHRWFSLLFRGGFSNVRGILRKSADAYGKNGDNVDRMFRDLKLPKN